MDLAFSSYAIHDRDLALVTNIFTMMISQINGLKQKEKNLLSLKFTQNTGLYFNGQDFSFNA